MNPIICIVGPTGVGKTKLSIELAKYLHAEIISCDSMQFYKGLDIGTAKVRKDETEGIKHHLIDILEPDESFSVAAYQKIVRKKIEELLKKKITPILVGGSGLFISSVIYHYEFLGQKRDSKNISEYEHLDLNELTSILKDKAPKIALNTDLTNKRRVLRALEKQDSDLSLAGKNLFYENIILFGLNTDRETLYKRIDSRVNQMIHTGLVEEAKKLYDLNLSTQATKAIGYKELDSYFKGESSLQESIELIKRNSRRYAKRQLTWFRNKMDCIWLDVDIDNFNKTIEEAKEHIK